MVTLDNNCLRHVYPYQNMSYYLVIQHALYFPLSLHFSPSLTIYLPIFHVVVGGQGQWAEECGQHVDASPGPDLDS